MMNKTFVLAALSSVSVLSADYYGPSSCPGGNCPYNQGRPYQGSSYYDDRNSYQGSSQYRDGSGQYQDRYYDNRSYDNRGQYQDSRGGQYHDRNYQDSRSGQYQDRNYQDGQYQDRSYQDNRHNQDRSYQDNRSNQDRDGYYNPSNTGNSKSSPTSYNDNRGNSRYADDRSGSRATATISDQDIAKDVHDILEADWLSSGYPDVTFDVNNGVVNLRGRVNTLDDKTKLENSIRKVDGVKQVKSEVTVIQDKTTGNRMKPSYLANNDKAYHDTKVDKTEKDFPRDTAASEADRHINSKIRHKLSGWFTKGYETIILNTENGVVTITGFVETPDDVQKISKEAKNIEGVKTVNNKVSVQQKR